MRLILQACALLLAIAVFPLPTSTTSALPTYSLSDIIAGGGPAQPLACAPTVIADGAQGKSARKATQPGISARNNDAEVIVIQEDIQVAKADPEPAPSANKEQEQGASTVSRLDRPTRPMAVITTDFEEGGLSEASFRTMACLDKDNEKEAVEEKVLVIGDSLSIPLGKRLEEYFSTLPGVNFKRLGKVSSGLARPDFFDWESTLTKLASSMKPTTVVVMIGTNDNQSLKRTDGSTVHFSDSKWDKEYIRRIHRVFEICRSNNPNVNIFWVGAPIMARTDLTNDVKRINAIIQDICAAYENCHYIDTWDALADDKGRFTDFMVDKSGEKVRIRANDGIHLSFFGAEILAGRTLRAMAPNVAVMRSIIENEPSG